MLTKKNEKNLGTGLIITLMLFAIATIGYQVWFASNHIDIIRRLDVYLVLSAFCFEMLAVMVLTFPYRTFHKRSNQKISFLEALSEVISGVGMAKVFAFGDLITWRKIAEKKGRNNQIVGRFHYLFNISMFFILFGLFSIFLVICSFIYSFPTHSTFAAILSRFPVVVLIVFCVAVLLRKMPFFNKRIIKLLKHITGKTTFSPYKIFKEAKYTKINYLEFIGSIVAIFCLEGLALVCLLWSISLDVPFLLGMYGYFFSRLMVLFPVIPGGVGESEAITTAFFSAYNFPSEPVLAVVLAFRILVFWIPASIGAVTGLFLIKGVNIRQRKSGKDKI